MRNKITVVGAGNVGANCALRIADKELADVVLVDVVDGVPQGKGLDILQSGPVQGYDISMVGANGYEETAGSDIAIITAGFPRKPGMSRDDLLMANYDVVRAATEHIVKYSAELDSDHGQQPAGRHVPDRLHGFEIQQEPGGGDGRRAG